MQSSDSLQSIYIGSRIAGKYEITDLIGEGGWSLVYKAHNRRIGKQVAIKILRDRFVDDAEKVARFRQEAQIVCSINHPNVVSVIDYGVLDNGQPYIVMDLLQGKDLGEAIDEGAMRWENVTIIMEDLAKALNAVHSVGLVHRDVKPSNVVLTTTSGGSTYAQLLDFGLVRSMAPDHSMTTTGQVIGTPKYMSPEQCRGAELDQRSDLYSLGCLAYQCLTGVPPFAADTHVEIMFKHVNEPVPPFAQAAPQIEIPPGLEAIVSKLLEKDPDRRYQTANELLDDLEQFREHPTSMNQLVAAMGRRRKEDKAPRIKWTMGMITGLASGVLAVAAVTACVTLAVTQHFYNPAPTPAKPDNNAAAQNTDAARQADALLSTGDLELSQSNFEQARRIFRRAQEIIAHLPDDEGRAELITQRLTQCRRGRAMQLFLTNRTDVDSNASVDRVVKIVEEHRKGKNKDIYDYFTCAEINALKVHDTVDGKIDRKQLAKDVHELNQKLHARDLLTRIDMDVCTNNNAPISYRAITETGGKTEIKTLGKTFFFDKKGHLDKVDEADGKTSWIFSEDGSFHQHVDRKPTGIVCYDSVYLNAKGEQVAVHWDGSWSLLRGDGTVVRYDVFGQERERVPIGDWDGL